MKTVLVAVDSQYVHMNLAIRSLSACCIETEAPILREYNINQQPYLILKDLLSLQPELAAFSCYIWNIEYVLRLCRDLKQSLPSVHIALGGPEVSFTPRQILTDFPEVDYVLCGEGEVSFPLLLSALKENRAPEIPGVVYRRGNAIVGDGRYQLIPCLDELPSPYPKSLPGGDSLPIGETGKILYYESSRGCPFSCSYCLSGAMGGGVRELSLPRVKEDLSRFVREGAPIVKLIDRTFNAHPLRAKEIVRYLIQLGGPTRFHLEIGADLLDEEFLALIASSPKGKFQLEAGVQSCNCQTLDAVVRHTRLDRLQHNVRVLMDCGKAHLHLDLIAGLPYEDYQSFAHSFDQVYRLEPHQLQLGFLKLLKGSDLWKQAQGYGLICRDYPPYEVLSTPWLSPGELLRLKGIEETVERYYNSGRARRAMAFLMEQAFPSPFACYEALADECDRRGYLDRPMSAANQITALGDFAGERLDSTSYGAFLTLLKLDYLSSGAKGAAPEIFEALRPSSSIQDRVRAAKRQGMITGHQARHAKFDLLPIQPDTGEAVETLIMVEPAIRDELTGECRVTAL